MSSPIRSFRALALPLAGLCVAALVVALSLVAQPDTAPSASTSPSAITLEPPTNLPVDFLYEPGVPVRKQYEDLQMAFGIRVLLDPQLPDMPSGTPEILQVDLFEALQVLTTSHGHFYKVLDPTTVLIAADTPQQRRQHDEQTIQTFYLENTRIGDGMTLLRSLLGLKHVAAHEENRTLTIRDTMATVAVAGDLIASFDHPPAEVELELLLIEVDPRALAPSSGDSPQRLTPAERDRLLTSGTLIERSQVAAVEGHRARLEIAEHFPLPWADSPSSRLGIDLRAKPLIHGGSREISLELGLGVHSITGWLAVGGSPKPVLGKRQLEATIRLADGATWLLRGFSGPSASNPPAGFEDLNTLGRWLTGQAPEGREMVLALTPRVVRGPGHAADDLRPQRIGTETRVVHHGNGLAIAP